MPTDAVASKGRQPHSGGGGGDGHRLGFWTVMPRAGPHIANGPGATVHTSCTTKIGQSLETQSLVQRKSCLQAIEGQFGAWVTDGGV